LCTRRPIRCASRERAAPHGVDPLDTLPSLSLFLAILVLNPMAALNRPLRSRRDLHARRAWALEVQHNSLPQIQSSCLFWSPGPQQKGGEAHQDKPFVRHARSFPPRAHNPSVNKHKGHHHLPDKNRGKKGPHKRHNEESRQDAGMRLQPSSFQHKPEQPIAKRG